MASDHEHWPNPGDAPTAEDLSRCVHCGLCLSSCPTYQVTGQEMESPRGRIYLARAVAEGDLVQSATIEQHWDLCLQCRACETACPSGVPYGRIMERVRAQVGERPASQAPQRRARRFLLRNTIARPHVLALLMAPARLVTGTPAVRRVLQSKLAPSLVRRGISQLPTGQGAPFRAGDRGASPPQPRARVALLTGCVMGELFGEVHRATVRVLERRGIRVEAPSEQRCCGALHAHDGDLEFARRLARHNIEAFEAGGYDAVVVNSAGCGAAMKEYGELLRDDDAWHDRAERFAATVRDFSEYLAELGGETQATLEARVAYQDACHLVHAQGIREEPRSLLSGIDGCSLVETAGTDRCCGAAGLYSLLQPAMSRELGRRKAEELTAVAPDVVVTANPGCQMQYNWALSERKTSARVMHLAEVLDEAESAAG